MQSSHVGFLPGLKPMPFNASSKAYEAAERRFAASNPRSKAIFERATKSLPGGNTRSVLYYTPFPLSISSASGSKLHDADGHTYTDLLGEYTAGLYGHSEPLITAAISEAIAKGLSFGSQHEDEVKLAELIKERFPSIDLLRFTNSGTEATLMALAAAKVYTGRNKILVFAGAYHGGAFSFKGMQSSPINAPHDYLIATYNDIRSARRILNWPASNGDDLAAIIVEPMVGSGGAIPAEDDFLIGLRSIANQKGAVLIYDEVMTSRMHSGGGIQSRFPLEQRPDMTTLGKYIGGGLSFGAFGGNEAIMSLFDPRRPNALAHAGTFNNNVLTMAAGRAGLEKIFTPVRAQHLHARGNELRHRLNELGQGTSMQVTGTGSIMCFHFTDTPAAAIKSHEDITDSDNMLSGLLHLWLLDRGWYIARRGFIALSLALTDEELNEFVQVVEEFVREFRDLLQCDP